MNDIVAVVVGIEKYDQPTWDLPGPCRNALDVTKYLIDLGTKPANIFLFVNEQPGEASPTACEQEIAEFKARGVKHELPTRESIDSCFNRLALNRDANSRLFFYWSGHGFTDEEDNYIFVCADYSSRIFKGKIFDATHRLRRLRSTQFKSFSQQIFLADVCAKEAEVEFGKDRDVLGRQYRRTQQLAFFATRDGNYSKGAFSAVALKHLKSTQQWPDLTHLSDNLWQALKNAQLEPLMIASFSREKQMLNESIGQPRGNGIADRVYDLLSRVPLRSAYRDYYAATMKDLGMREASGKPDLWRMIVDLSELQDGSSNYLPYGLVQFLVRVSRHPDAGQATDQWIAQNMTLIHQHHLTSVDETLATEQAEKILVFEVENDLSEPTKLSWFVCSRNNSRLSAAGQEPQDVRNWADLGEKVMSVVDNLERQDTTIVEIHFAVESMLFDRDFHRIRSTNTACLGEQYIVVLRHLARVYKSKASPVRKTWEGWATALRGTQPAQVKRIRIPADQNNLSRLFEAGRGLCYAGFVFACPTDGLPTERDVMNRLVELMGAPYVFWLQRAPNGEWATDLDCRLERWLAECGGLGEFPSKLLEKRAGAEEFASYGALLWDDPNFLPFTQKTSPSQG